MHKGSIFFWKLGVKGFCQLAQQQGDEEDSRLCAAALKALSSLVLCYPSLSLLIWKKYFSPGLVILHALAWLQMCGLLYSNVNAGMIRFGIWAGILISHQIFTM
jgi:hypothetical protein